MILVIPDRKLMVPDDLCDFDKIPLESLFLYPIQSYLLQ